MTQPPYLPITKGMFLVASPELNQGLYSRSVILICEHNPGGSFGLIINKPLDMRVPSEALNLEDAINPNLSALAGGSIQPSQMMLLHSSSAIPDQTLNVCKGIFLGGNLEFLKQEASNSEGAQIRLCFGYSAWGSGQLEREFLSKAWFLHPASDTYLFHTPHELIWKSILRDMGGKYTTLSMIPEDLSLN